MYRQYSTIVDTQSKYLYSTQQISIFIEAIQLCIQADSSSIPRNTYNSSKTSVSSKVNLLLHV